MNESDSRVVLPDWMGESGKKEKAYVHPGKRHHNFLGQSILGMRRILAEEMLTETYAATDGWLQRVDPRIKLVSTVIFIILVSLTRNLYILLGMWVFTFAFMQGSKLPLLSLQKRIWGIFPLLTLLISIPAMFNLVTEGTPLLMIYRSASPHTWLGLTIPANIYVSQQGFTAAITLCLRVGISLSLGTLLVMTTPVARLLKSLQIMGLSSLIVMIIEMCYRYLVLLLNLSIEMFEARSLRTVGALSLTSKREQVASSIAALFARSMELSEEVYLAMAARGYTGEAVSIDHK